MIERYRKCSVDWYGANGSTPRQQCAVFFDGLSIRFVYVWDGRSITYHGTAHGIGHYRLHCDNISGRNERGVIEMHRFDEASRMVGYWFELATKDRAGQQGMFEITLEDE